MRLEPHKPDNKNKHNEIKAAYLSGAFMAAIKDIDDVSRKVKVNVKMLICEVRCGWKVTSSSLARSQGLNGKRFPLRSVAGGRSCSSKRTGKYIWGDWSKGTGAGGKGGNDADRP